MEENAKTKFRRVRRLFPIAGRDSGITYLNSASTGPLCRPVRKALNDYYESTGYLKGNADIGAFAALDNIRRFGASLIGADKREVGFGFHTGFGLNIAAFGLPLKRGDEVLLSDVEFPSNVYPWMALRQRGVRVRFMRSRHGIFNIDNLVSAIGKSTRVLSLSFVQFFNGYKNDLEAIGAVCRERGIYFVVDGIQGCGHQPLDVHACGIDIFSSGGQKWLLAPLGTGIFYVRKDLQDHLSMPFASWLSVDWKLNFSDLFHYDLPFFNSARRFELGTYPYAHVHAMEAALKLIVSLGVKNIQRHNHALLDLLIAYLKSRDCFRIVSDLGPRHRSSILSFTCPGAKEVHAKLMKRKFICAFREGSIRISPHLFNNRFDILKLIDVLDRLVR
jgi:cysteine desulfurase/selenocysteine lyase